MLSGVVAARGRRYVMMNATVDTLPAIRAVLPSMGAPTVLPLADEGEIAVHAAVDADDVWSLLPALREAGASSILVLPIERLVLVRGAGLDDAFAAVAPIVADVRERGDAALLEWTERFDGPRPDGLRVPAERIEAAAVEPTCSRRSAHDPGGTGSSARRSGPPTPRSRRLPASSRSGAGSPLDSVGVCVPSGRAPLPSSLVMTAVPAQVAGVRRIAVVTPRPVDATLVVARELGLDEVYAVGGAQAVAALAYGTESIPAVDKIVGPGNAFVTAAKLLVSSRVGIDLPAGPSEVVVIADETADPAACAADLLAQAEHGADSEALLLTTDAGLSDAGC